MIKGFLLLLAFFTRIPLPFKIEFDEKLLARSIVFAPLIGIIIGLLLIVINNLFSFLKTPLLTALFLTFFWIVITGGLHLDGLADTCDGIFSNQSPEKILEIMKDSRIGTNGTIGLVFIILLKACCLYYLMGSQIWQALLLSPCLGRMNILWCAALSQYARQTKGMGQQIANATGVKEAVITTFLAFLAAIILFQIKGIIVLSVVILIGILIINYVKKKIRGVTGDIFGFITEITEVLTLFLILVISKVII